MKLLKNVVIQLICILIFCHGLAQKVEYNQVFHFGNQIDENSGVIISQSKPYDDKVGYGFDCDSAQNVVVDQASITSDTSIYFSIKLPEGNYKIEVTLGGNKDSQTTVKAESRRLMLDEIRVAKNDTAHFSFVVNVRTPKIDDEHNINIKSREVNYLNWDDKLTLEFLGNPAVRSIQITSISKITTLFLAGDSTVTDQDVEPWASWGQFITQFFDDNIVVANYANSGASLNSFKASHRLEKVLGLMQPGDYLFIEFGHNDEKIKGDGNGAWGLYTNLLKEFVTRSREKGGIPVLITPTQRRFFEADGTLKSTHGDFPDAMRKVAEELHVPLIDLTKITTDLYEAWGDNDSRKAFVQYPADTFPGQVKALEDNTHFNNFGANEIAKCIVKGIRDLSLDIGKNLKPNIPVFNPKNPDRFIDWTLPMSTRFENTKPDGN